MELDVLSAIVGHLCIIVSAIRLAQLTSMEITKLSFAWAAIPVASPVMVRLVIIANHVQQE
jgi:hypothetical protein